MHVAAAPAQDSFAGKIQPLLSKYCYKCHGAGPKPKADLNLSSYSTEASIRGNRKVWKELLNKMLTKEMPPDDFQPQPAQEERETIVKFVQAALNKVDPGAPKTAGRVTARRLNRTEYRNTVRDLLGTPVNLAANQAQITTSTLPTGIRAINAVYSGDANFESSSGVLNPPQLVNRLNSTTTLSSGTARAKAITCGSCVW